LDEGSYTMYVVHVHVCGFFVTRRSLIVWCEFHLIVSFIYGPRQIFARQEDGIFCDVGHAKW
jgi:hypothetical protein